MPRKYTFVNIKREASLVRSRIYIAAVLILFLLLGLVIRIFYLQVIMHDHYTTLSRNNRVKIQPIPPTRGLIFSSDGVLLADNRPSYSVEITPEQVADMDNLVSRLNKLIVIENSDLMRFRKQLTKKRRFESIPLRFNLSDEEVAIISVNQHRLQGVDIVPRLNRYYPVGENLAHAIGYVGLIDEEELQDLDISNYSGTTHIGKTGVEKAYEDILHGTVGYQQVEVNAQGRVIRVLDRIPPLAGKNIYLTLNVALQNLAVDSLQGHRGAIVAVEPATGAILALVSSPGFDPNLFVNGIDKNSYRNLIESEFTPLINRALQGKYPPGSTIKPFMALDALNYGVRTPQDTTWCPGWYTLPGKVHRYRDWKKNGHGHIDMVGALAQSCDVYFFALATDMGIDRVDHALEQFGFGRRTGIDIGSETTGLLPTPAWKRKKYNQPWYPGDTVNIGIGQGLMLVTPLQLAFATALLANHGMMYTPHLLAGIQSSTANGITKYSPERDPVVVSVTNEDYWNDVIHGMAEVVQGARGTARRAGLDAPYKFAGKTGSAQVIKRPEDEEAVKQEDLPEEFRDHALFIAFAPLQSPRIAVAIIVEHGAHGATSAAPIARRLFDFYLEQIKHD